MQDDILREVGPEAFELGLLMGTESDPREEEESPVYCFHHLLLLEFCAAKYVALLTKVCFIFSDVKWALAPPPPNVH